MRILGIAIPDDKQLEFGLTSVYGIGRSRAKSLLAGLGIDHVRTAASLSPEEEIAIRTAIDELILEGDLRRQTSQNIKRLKDIEAYRGLRHKHSLPVRGQRSKTNSRTVRGNKRNTMASGRVKVSKT